MVKRSVTPSFLKNAASRLRKGPSASAPAAEPPTAATVTSVGDVGDIEIEIDSDPTQGTDHVTKDKEEERSAAVEPIADEVDERREPAQAPAREQQAAEEGRDVIEEGKDLIKEAIERISDDISRTVWGASDNDKGKSNDKSAGSGLWTGVDKTAVDDSSKREGADADPPAIDIDSITTDDDETVPKTIKKTGSHGSVSTMGVRGVESMSIMTQRPTSSTSSNMMKSEGDNDNVGRPPRHPAATARANSAENDDEDNQIVQVKAGSRPSGGSQLSSRSYEVVVEDDDAAQTSPTSPASLKFGLPDDSEPSDEKEAGKEGAMTSPSNESMGREHDDSANALETFGKQKKTTQKKTTPRASGNLREKPMRRGRSRTSRSSRNSRSYSQGSVESFDASDADHTEYSYETETDDDETTNVFSVDYSTSFGTSYDEEDVPSPPPTPHGMHIVDEEAPPPPPHAKSPAKSASKPKRSKTFQKGMKSLKTAMGGKNPLRAENKPNIADILNNEAAVPAIAPTPSVDSSRIVGSMKDFNHVAKDFNSGKSRNDKAVGNKKKTHRRNQSSLSSKDVFWYSGDHTAYSESIATENDKAVGNKKKTHRRNQSSLDSKDVSWWDHTAYSESIATEAGSSLTLPTKGSIETGFTKTSNYLNTTKKVVEDFVHRNEDGQLLVCVDEHGGVEKLNVQQSVHIPRVQRADDVIVAVDASTITVQDCMIRRGQWEVVPPLPFVPGADMIGTVVEMGPAAKGHKVGDRVAALPGSGCNAHYVTLPAHSLIPVPDGMDPAVAVSMLSTYVPARQVLDLGRVRNTPYTGANVLIIGGNGAMGLALLELFLLEGANVYIVAEEKHHDYLRKMGATRCLPIDPEKWQTKIAGKMDLVIDSICIDGYKSSVSALNSKGKLICTGMSAMYTGMSAIYTDELEVANCDGWLDMRSYKAMVTRFRAKYMMKNTEVYNRMERYGASPGEYAQHFRYLCFAALKGAITPVIASRSTVDKIAAEQRLIEQGECPYGLSVCCRQWVVDCEDK